MLKIKENFKNGSAGQNNIEPKKRDEEDFILIDGIKYEKEIANIRSNIKLESLPSQDGKKVQKNKLKTKFDPYTGDPIYE